MMVKDARQRARRTVRINTASGQMPQKYNMWRVKDRQARSVAIPISKRVILASCPVADGWIVLLQTGCGVETQPQ